MTSNVLTSYDDTSLWPSRRAQNFARHLEKSGYLERPGSRWTHTSAIESLATHFHLDIKTFLATHPVEFAAPRNLLKLLPRDVVTSYHGPARQKYAGFFRKFIYGF